MTVVRGAGAAVPAVGEERTLASWVGPGPSFESVVGGESFSEEIWARSCYCCSS